MKTTKWSRISLAAVALLLSAGAVSAQDDLVVSNVVAEKRAFSALVDVVYDLETVDGLSVTVSLYLSTDSGASYPHPCLAVSGDVGGDIMPAPGLHIVWDAGEDFPGFSSPTCRLRVTADDSPGPAEFIYIAPGTFTMGSPTIEPGHNIDEVQHTVTLTTPFYMSIMEVTNAQYAALAQWALDHDPPLVTATSTSLQDALEGSTQELLDLNDEDCDISFSGGVFTVEGGKEDHPALEVSWYGAVAYCDWLSLQGGLTRAYDHSTWECNNHDPYDAQGYRLPTEAEWEYACRAGSETAFTNGDITNIECSDPILDQIGWYCGNANDWTHPVGQRLVNDFGLYDIHGNLVEWCNDWYGGYGGDVTDPAGPASGTDRVLRGGSWSYDAENCRSAVRYDSAPEYTGFSYGFRPVRSTN
jgi:formylglycine-generating enzyme required for sulfatase activity